MQVLELINNNQNWEEILTQSPYYIKIKRDGNYVILTYNQLNSDFLNPIVRECRGVILYLNDNGEYECVCRAFDKFGNHGELYVKDIDWNSVVVEEKVDGSLIKIWHHNDEWHISTNSTIDAFEAQIGDTELTFGDLVNKAIGCSQVPYFLEELNKNTTYMFELVSPESKVTIFYPETRLYYLGQRDMKTMIESKQYTDHMQEYGILCPKIYPLSNIESCLEYVENMSKDEEGFVIRDKDFNRMKLKSPKYLMAFHMNNNGVITTKRIIKMLKADIIDDFMAYCPEYKSIAQEVIDDINKVAAHMEFLWDNTPMVIKQNRKEFAAHVQEFFCKEFLFVKLDHPELVASDWLMSQSTNKIKDMIKLLKIYYS